jgi:predicted nucleotidyltransferase
MLKLTAQRYSGASFKGCFGTRNWRPTFCRQQICRNGPTRVMSSDISALRKSAATALSQKDFQQIIWAGVFGSFATGKQTENSDVDVVVTQKPDDPAVNIPPDTLHLEDELPRIWGRKVDIVYITRGEELRGYISIESLLCSQSLYGSDQDPVVIQLRKDAKNVLDLGFNHFTNILADIRRTQALVAGISRQVGEIATL